MGRQSVDKGAVLVYAEEALSGSSIARTTVPVKTHNLLSPVIDEGIQDNGGLAGENVVRGPRRRMLAGEQQDDGAIATKGPNPNVGNLVDRSTN